MFSTFAGARAAHIDAIEAALIDWLSNETRTTAFEKAQAEHVPCFPVHTAAEVADNAQYKARGFLPIMIIRTGRECGCRVRRAA